MTTVGINGPFGVGKSTLTRSLAINLPESMTCDPEWLGANLHRLVPTWPTGDYQDLPHWRAMTEHAIIETSRSCERVVNVPMSMVQADSLDEIQGGVIAAGLPLIHVFLDADAETLRERIDADTVEANAWEWRPDPW